MTKDTGGPAFPRSGVKDGYGKVVGDVKGMSLRDWFAGQALAGIAAGYWSNSDMSDLAPSELAEKAFALADAMLAERAEG